MSMGDLRVFCRCSIVVQLRKKLRPGRLTHASKDTGAGRVLTAATSLAWKEREGRVLADMEMVASG